MPDKLIETSVASLCKAGFLLCTQGPDCSVTNLLRCPLPTTHLHINDELTISLFRKSDVLQEFPDLDFASKNKTSYIMHASDTQLPSASPGCGRGRFSLDLSSTRIPSALKYCEAIILLLCRDYGSVYEPYWISILTYLVEFVDGLDIFEEEKLREDYKQFYHALKHGDPRMYSLLELLLCDLICNE